MKYLANKNKVFKSEKDIYVDEVNINKCKLVMPVLHVFQRFRNQEDSDNVAEIFAYGKEFDRSEGSIP